MQVLPTIAPHSPVRDVARVTVAWGDEEVRLALAKVDPFREPDTEDDMPG